MLQDYGKHVFTDRRDRRWVVQPKSFSQATQRDEKEVLDLLLSGEYVLVTMAIPKGTKEMTE